MASVERTLLLTDVVDSTKLVERLGDVRAADVWARHDTLARELLVEHSGLEIDKTDGFLFLFERPVDGVRYAIAFHGALARLSAELGIPLAARAGLHTGQVVLRENPPEQVARGAKPLEVEGIAKPTAARVMSLARGRQTLITTEARAALSDADLGDVRTMSHGHWRVKGVSEPIELFEVGGDAAPFIPPPDAAKVYRVTRDGGLWTPARSIPNNLERDHTRLFGREDDLRAVHALIEAGHAIVSVVGPAGVGTSTLARRYAATWLGDWPGGVWWVDAAAVRDLDSLAVAVAAALPPEADGSRRELSGAVKTLVVLDGLVPTPKTAQAVTFWRHQELIVLVTASRPLGVSGEAVRVLRPLLAGEPPSPTDPALALFLEQARAVAPEVDDGPESLAHMAQVIGHVRGLPRDIARAAIRAHGVGAARPYRGLGSFRAEHADLFFGRDAQAERLVDRIRAHPFVTVTGASGAGKTSLLQAGVARYLPERDLVVMRPGSEPEAALRRALAGGADPSRTVLVVDQAEELVTLARHDRASRFAQAVLAWRARGEGRVVFSVRGDFFARLAEVPPLLGVYSDCVEVLVHPSKDALAETLVRPAALFGALYEDGLPELMVDRVADEPAALALLQFCADQLWDRRQGHRLTKEAYEAVGGVEGALAAHADRVLAAMSAPQRAEARRLFLRLTTEEMTKEPRPRQDLVESAADPEQAIAVLGRLVQARLLTMLESEDGGAVVEIVHEALLRHWQQVSDWLGEDREGQRMLRSVGYAATEWDARGRAADLLWRGQPLLELQGWRLRTEPRLTPLEEAFVQSCLAAQQARRRRRQGIAAIVALALLTVSVVTTGLWRQSVRATELAELNALIARAQVDVARGNHVRAIRRAREAFEREPGYEPARSGLYQSIAARGEEAVHLVPTDFGAAVFSPDGTRAILYGRTHKVILVDGQGTRMASVDRRLRARGFMSHRWSPDSRVALALGNHAPLVVVDRDGAELAVLEQFDSRSMVELAGPAPWLLVGDEQGFAIHTLDGEPIDGVTGPVRPARSVAWTPDGRSLAVSWGSGVRLFGFDGAALSHLGDVAEPCVSRKVWHPDGDRLALSGPRCDRIWIVDRAGAPIEERHVGVKDARVWGWSPDGSRFLASAEGRVLMQDADGGPVPAGQIPDCAVRPTQGEPWSPDGAHFLACVRPARPGSGRGTRSPGRSWTGTPRTCGARAGPRTGGPSPPSARTARCASGTPRAGARRSAACAPRPRPGARGRPTARAWRRQAPRARSPCSPGRARRCARRRRTTP